MTSRERFFSVFSGELPDRVPLMEMIVDAHVCQQISGSPNYYDFYEKSDFYDIVICCAGVVHPGRTRWIDEKKGTFVDKWGVMQQFTNQFMPHVIGDPVLRSVADLETYLPPDPNDAEILADAEYAVRRFKDKKAVGFLGEDTFAATQLLLGGPEELFVALKLDPEFVKKVTAKVEQYHIQLYKNVLSKGVDVIILGDDYGTNQSSMMSPDDFKEFFLPAITHIVDTVHALGGKVIKHTDGNIWGLMDSFVQSGLDAMGPLQHECGMHLDQLMAKYEKMVFVGNVPVDILITGTPEDVTRTTKEFIRRCSPSGRHILSSGNSITCDIPPENLRAMIETAHRFGRYPI